MDLPITLFPHEFASSSSYTGSEGFARRKYVKFSRENFAFQLDVHVFKTTMSSKSLISNSVGGLFKAVESVVMSYTIIIHNYRLKLLRADLSGTRSECALPFVVCVSFYNETLRSNASESNVWLWHLWLSCCTSHFKTTTTATLLRPSGIQIEYWIQEGFLVPCNSPSHMVLKGLEAVLR